MSRSRYYPGRRRDRHWKPWSWEADRHVKLAAQEWSAWGGYLEFWDTWDQDANVLDYDRPHVPEPGRRATLRQYRRLLYEQEFLRYARKRVEFLVDMGYNSRDGAQGWVDRGSARKYYDSRRRGIWKTMGKPDPHEDD